MLYVYLCGFFLPPEPRRLLGQGLLCRSPCRVSEGQSSSYVPAPMVEERGGPCFEVRLFPYPLSLPELWTQTSSSLSESHPASLGTVLPCPWVASGPLANLPRASVRRWRLMREC